MTTLHVISHTHWDREWHQTFQQFRLKLVKLVDDLLDIYASDPDFQYFMLDGQTIVLDDYLYMRPEREAELRDLVQSGRLLIGPWHILPDEFLVSPEATVRNLLQGDRTARRFGNKMMVGYIPDPFGHIGQMPQILRGFGIQYASVQRGLNEEPCEFWWQAPDGSQVLMAYLRDGYGNAADLPAANPSVFAEEALKRAHSLAPHSQTNHRLLMFGTDHMPVSPHTSAAIAYTKQCLDGDTIIHSTLPLYFDAIQSSMPELPVVRGELRMCRRHHLLPAVLSTRVWIKQRNHACETLLERWAEPFSAFTGRIYSHYPALKPAESRLSNPAPLIRQAWRLLMENHPHDSICGCSIDPVHEEMRSRFDQVEQIGEEITRQSLEALAAAVDTTSPPGQTAQAAIVVFNPNDIELTGEAQAEIEALADFELVDENGNLAAFEAVERSSNVLAELNLDQDGLMKMISAIGGGGVSGRAGASLSILDVSMERRPDALHITAMLGEISKPDPALLDGIGAQLINYLADPLLNRFVVTARTPRTRIRFNAAAVPPHGWRTWWVRPVTAAAPVPPVPAGSQSDTIENEFFTVSASPLDGTLTLLDRRTGQSYPGLNRLIDGGDAGDEYNYSPPAHDLLLGGQVRGLRVEKTALDQSLHLDLEIPIPSRLAQDRRARSTEFTPLKIAVTARLLSGVPRLDIHTRVENHAADHRLRAHFPAPFPGEFEYDGHYEVVNRPARLPETDATWVEEPRPEVPMRQFAAITGSQGGLVIAARGLREAAGLTTPGGQCEIVLTLLRCVGWLSRSDLATRRGDAGPQYPTPAAQLEGVWEFDCSVIPALPSRKVAAFHQAYAFNAPLRAAVTAIHSGPLQPMGSFLVVDPPEFVISTVKTAEDGRDLIVRGYNLGEDAVEVHLRLSPSPTRITRTRLDEVPQSSLEGMGQGEMNFTASRYEIVTHRCSDVGMN